MSITHAMPGSEALITLRGNYKLTGGTLEMTLTKAELDNLPAAQEPAKKQLLSEMESAMRVGQKQTMQIEWKDPDTFVSKTASGEAVTYTRKG